MWSPHDGTAVQHARRLLVVSRVPRMPRNATRRSAAFHRVSARERGRHAVAASSVSPKRPAPKPFKNRRRFLFPGDHARRTHSTAEPRTTRGSQVQEALPCGRLANRVMQAGDAARRPNERSERPGWDRESQTRLRRDQRPTPAARSRGPNCRAPPGKRKPKRRPRNDERESARSNGKKRSPLPSLDGEATPFQPPLCRRP